MTGSLARELDSLAQAQTKTDGYTERQLVHTLHLLYRFVL